MGHSDCSTTVTLRIASLSGTPGFRHTMCVSVSGFKILADLRNCCAAPILLLSLERLMAFLKERESHAVVIWNSDEIAI